MKGIINRKTLIIAITVLLAIAFFQVKVFATEATDTSFTLAKESANVNLNGSAYISYTGGTGVVEWKSSDDSIATVENGTVKGHKIGTATITATRGEETATCEINVVYALITIGGNANDHVYSVNLVLNEHPSENLYATVEDGNYEEVETAKVTWSSSDTNIVTVDENTGTITGVKDGTATITASAAGVTDTCEVTVAKAPVFTDFSNAKYELLFDVQVDLKITGITPSDDNYYAYIITSSNTKPTITKDSWGALDTTTLENSDTLLVNSEENYMYDRNLDKYVELNQDMYLWIIENVKLDAGYALSEESYISYSSKFVAEGIKLEKPELPQLNLILKSFSIWGGETSEGNEESTYINFRFPSEVENRKFKLKIGKVTDNKILQKIQNNDYSGITDLLAYAKNNSAVYSADLTTTNSCYYRNENALFDGTSLLQNRAYYFIYVEFDDEEGKYCPIEGVTLGQAFVRSSTIKFWDLCAYTADNFEWTNLSTTPTETEKEDEPDDTVAPEKLPNAGSLVDIVIIVILGLGVIGTVMYKKIKYLNFK